MLNPAANPSVARTLAATFSYAPTLLAADMEAEVREQALADARAGLWDRAESLLEALAEELSATPEIFITLARRRTEQNRLAEASALLSRAEHAMSRTWGRVH